MAGMLERTETFIQNERIGTETKLYKKLKLSQDI